MTDEKWKKKHENKLDALTSKIEFERRNGFRKNNRFQFIGGVLQYHQWITLLTGITFVSLGLLHQRGSFLYFYLFGLIKIIKDTVETFLGLETLKLSPLIYYMFGGLISLIILTQIGYPIPDVTYGLIYNTSEVLP